MENSGDFWALPNSRSGAECCFDLFESVIYESYGAIFPTFIIAFAMPRKTQIFIKCDGREIPAILAFISYYIAPQSNNK